MMFIALKTEDGILQSMNSARGRCHDNARCESMRARMKEELLYGRYHTEEMNTGELKPLIWRYFISYWNKVPNIDNITLKNAVTSP